MQKEKKIMLRCLWTVSIKDREDPDMDIWTASFSTEEKVDAFKASAEEKLKAYGVFGTVDVTKDCSTINDDMYLDWIDERYGDPPDHVFDHVWPRFDHALHA